MLKLIMYGSMVGPQATSPIPICLHCPASNLRGPSSAVESMPNSAWQVSEASVFSKCLDMQRYINLMKLCPTSSIKYQTAAAAAAAAGGSDDNGDDNSDNHNDHDCDNDHDHGHDRHYYNGTDDGSDDDSDNDDDH